MLTPVLSKLFDSLSLVKVGFLGGRGGAFLGGKGGGSNSDTCAILQSCQHIYAYNSVKKKNNYKTHK